TNGVALLDVDAVPKAIVVQPDSKPVILGQDGTSFKLYRFSSSGALESSFTSSIDLGSGSDPVADALARDSSGRFIVAGRANNNFVIVRFNSNGGVDSSFGTAGKVSIDFDNGVDKATGLYVYSDGSILVSGSKGTGSVAVAKLNANGTLNTSFRGGG